jgi:hypothetical protein
VIAVVVIGGAWWGIDSLASNGAKTSAASVTASPSPTANTGASSRATPAPSVVPSDIASLPNAPHHVAPASARNGAAAILHANDAYYQQEFNEGVTVSLARGQSNSFPAYHAWQTEAATDVAPGNTAFAKADAYFTADDEPSSISDWQADNGTLQSDLFKLAQDSLGVGGPGDLDSQARASVAADIKQEQHDFAVAEHDAERVAAGQ